MSGIDTPVTMDRPAFVERLLELIPEVQSVVEEHLSDFDGEVLLHLLVADLRRLAEEEYRSEGDLLLQLLSYLDLALDEGDDDVVNAISVSFVEDALPWDPGSDGFVDVWPAGLRAEAIRQRNHLPGSN